VEGTGSTLLNYQLQNTVEIFHDIRRGNPQRLDCSI